MGPSIKYRIILFFLFVSTLCYSNLYCHTQRYDDKKIEHLNLLYHEGKGSGTFDAHVVKMQMLTKEKALFSQLDFDTDLKKLSLEYDRVEPTMTLSGNALSITINIWPHPLIRSITWKGAKHIKKSRLEKELGIAPFTPFDRDSFNKAFYNLKQLYTKKGFFEAELSFDIDRDKNTDEVDITITIDEGRSGVISSIDFHGITKEEERDILSMVNTKKYNLFTSWMSGSGKYNEDLVEIDRLVIYNYFQNKGYADAVVSIAIKESGKKRIILDVTVDKKGFYTFDSISFSGNTLFDDAAIISMLPIHEGDAYSPDKIRESVHSITEAYGRKGYIEAYISPAVSLHANELHYSVNFIIEEGLQYRIGLIKISGNDVTRNKVILHESLLVPGEIFNTTKLEKTEERLLNIGYFETVNIYPSNSHDENPLGPQFRDVVIEVDEASTGSLGVSMGFSTSDSLFVALDILERNFDVSGFPRLFQEGYEALRGAGEYAHFKVNVGKKQRSYLLSLTKPYFMDTPWTLGCDVVKNTNRYQSNDYDINSLSFGVNAYYNINQFLKFGTNYRLSDIDVKEKGNSGENDNAKKEALTRDGLTSTIGTSLLYDSTNRPRNPSRGFRSRFSLEYTGLGGDYHFGKIGYTNSYYYPLSENGVLKCRLDLHFIQPLGTKAPDLPLNERLLLGGDDNVRGYRDYSIGPKYSDNTAQGGISQMLLSGEYLYRIHHKLGIFAFTDAGSVSEKKYQFGAIRASYGAGVRVELFKGAPPLSIGYGVPLNAKEKSDERKFFLSIGAQF